MRRHAVALAIAAVAGLAGATAVAAQSEAEAEAQAVDRPTLEDLILGAPAHAQPTRFREFACGTNGGPPSILIGGFADYARCPAEAGTGLHEVQFRYDDEVEYWALANDLPPIADRFGGTRYGTFPVIVSALFDAQGMLRGYRAVTDDRGSPRQRRVAYTMGIFAKAQFGADGWTCEDLPPEDGETPVGRNFVKEDCTRTTPEGWTVTLRTRLLHRPGQSAIDPHSGEVRAGLYESTARLEVFEKGYGPAAADLTPTEAFLMGRSKDCPGCDLAEADLTYRDLSEANLAGANLTRARLHRATLTRANLAGATLTEANLNAVDAKFADLSGADLTAALLYEANLSGANLSRATLADAKAQHAVLARAKLPGATWTGSNASGVVLTGADLSGAVLTQIYMPQADLRQATITDADLTDGIFFEATFVGAELSGVTAATADFRNARLNDASFAGADLTGATFSQAWTEGADFTGANLDGATGLSIR